MIQILPPSVSRLILIPITLTLFIPGCRSVQLAPASLRSAPSSYSSTSTSTISTDTPATTPSRWPMRWGNNPDQPGTIIDLDPADPLRPIHLSRYHQFRSTDIEYSDANQLAADIGITIGFKFKAEAPGSFLFVPNPKNESNPDLTKDTGKQSPSNLPDLAFKFVSATPIESDAAVAEPAEDHVELQRTWFTCRDPDQKQEQDDPIGTIVLLPGMFGTPDVIVDALENYWHHQGYEILRMRSHPSRFTQHAMMKVVAGQELSIAQQAAAINDDRVAEGAYATKAALDHLFALRPNLADKPTVLVGMSGGAMMLPTVYAYSPESYSGAVLIAGGADFLTIAIKSNYKSWIDAMVFDFSGKDVSEMNMDLGKPSVEQMKVLSQGYLLSSKLDAYHTATEMGEVPVLMLHATTDKAVPAATGELLYEQLGKPERWSYPIGHELIFAGLPTQVARIDLWITKHVLESD